MCPSSTGFGFQVPGSGFRVLGSFGFRVPGSRFRVSSFRFRVSDSGFQAPGSGFRVPSFRFRVSGSVFRVSKSGFQVPNSGFPRSSFRFRVQGSGFQVPGSGFRVSGSRFRVPGFWFQIPVFGCRVLVIWFWFAGFGGSKPVAHSRLVGMPLLSIEPLDQSGALPRLLKSSLSIALICKAGRRISASASTNQGAGKGDLVLFDRASRPERRASAPARSRVCILIWFGLRVRICGGSLEELVPDLSGQLILLEADLFSSFSLSLQVLAGPCGFS